MEKTKPAKDESITRYGTFLNNSNDVPKTIAGPLKDLFVEALRTASSDEERNEILMKLHEDLTNNTLSGSIQTEDKSTRFSLTKQEIDWMERQPQERWLDYLVYRYQFKIYPRLRKLRKFPIHLLIEPTSICNLRCIMCFQADKTFTSKEHMGTMPFELFTRIVDQAREHQCQAITMASRGEPTLVKRFGDMLSYAANAGVMDLKINTNATRLTEQLCHSILSAGVNEVVFSVDAGTKETYESIRVNGVFEDVVANVERFNQIRAKHYPHSPTVTRISGVKVKEDQDKDQMVSFWRERVDQVTIKRALPRWDSYNNERVHAPDPCSVLWERTYVWYDGRVNPCDFDYKTYLCVGNAYEEPLSEIWLGEKYRRMREDHSCGRRGSYIPCDRCPIY